jgi:anti-sigma regulatory factor (Ser/Thr protein kinase)
MTHSRQGSREARLRDTQAELTLSVPASAEAGPVLRRAVRSLDSWFGTARPADVELLVTELATNGVKHADAECGCDRITLDARVDANRLRIAVRDCGRGFHAQPQDGEREQPGGWGLVLVEDISDRWGVEREPTTTVWFELERAA